MWANPNITIPQVNGYYYTLYKHKNGNEYYKALWWDGYCFAYKDYVTYVVKYIPLKFDYYVPCEQFIFTQGKLFNDKSD